MIYHGTYVIEGDRVIYEPTAGPTIKEAIGYAVDLSKQEKKLVELHLNDIVLEVNQNSDITKIAIKYFSKLERKYRGYPYNATYHRGLTRGGK